MPSPRSFRAHVSALRLATVVRSLHEDLFAKARGRIALRTTTNIGRDARCFGTVLVENRGAIRVGDGFAVGGTRAAVQIVAEVGGFVGIGDDVSVEYGTTISANSVVSIGSRVRIGPHCVISDSVLPLRLVSAGESQTPGIMIGNDVWLGAGVTVMPGVRIGDRAVVAAGSLVHKDIPEDALAAGSPATVLRVGGRAALVDVKSARGRATSLRASRSTVQAAR